ncbi:MAG: glycosyltransferase family 4 protein [Candidatus Heimdallarchaeota archaeon]|nr:glycosyltransferase family 4 protein [Candidatus Heimdallarchaeota archaeon]
MEVNQIIIFFVERYSKNDIGGVKTYLRRIITSLIKANHDSIILTQKTKQDNLDEEIIDSIKVVRLDCGDFINRIEMFNKLSEEEKNSKANELFKKNDIEKTALKLANELNLFILKYNPRAIHFHNSYFISPYALYFLKQNYRYEFPPSYYFWSHSPSLDLILPDGSKSKLYSALKSFQNEYKGIFAISNSVNESMIKYGINSKLKYLGVDLTVFTKREIPIKITREGLGIHPKAFVILFTGRILKEKGLDLLPEIFDQLIHRDEKYFAVKFLITGDGEYKTELQNKIKEKGFENNFQFIRAENEDELVDIYSLADCFILPSRREALGLSLLEALSCSLPSIATDLPGIRELITHTKNGLLVPVDNISEILRWITGLYSNTILRENLKESSRKSVEEIFSYETHLNFFIKKLTK